MDSIELLGHEVNGEEIKVQPVKIGKIMEFKPPKNKKDVQSFLGCLNYISKFVENFNDKITNIQALLKGKKFEWSEDHQKEFDLLKEYLVKIKPHSINDPDKPKIIELNPSNRCLSASLFQQGNFKELVDYKSRLMKSP